MDQMGPLAKAVMEHKYAHVKPDGTKETWEEIARRVSHTVLDAARGRATPAELERLKESAYRAVLERKFIPGGRYLYAAARPFHQVQNCLMLRADDSREGWADLLHKSAMALMTGAGIGIDYSDVRAKGSPISRTGGTATGPIALMCMINECARGIQQGGSRRSAVWAGLRWSHPDIMDFIHLKDWPDEIKALKARDFNAAATMDMTNISVILDKAFFDAYSDPNDLRHSMSHRVFDAVTRQMVSTAEPGFSVDYANPRESLRNACTELTSEDDSDICNIGSINLARVESLEEFKELVAVSTAFLLAGTLYSDVPYDLVDKVRTRNRRLGLGLMGIHEWLLKRGYRYEPNAELGTWLSEYARSTDIAMGFADSWTISRPVKTRAIAPTGSIGILAETTTGIEPIFCVAMRRRYLKGDTWHYQFVVDPTARRLIDGGVQPHDIEDAGTLAMDVDRRLEFQAWVQQFVDHGISSTINLPAWGSQFNNEETLVKFRQTLIKYLPRLRGMTCYPDGCRSGQPITPVEPALALAHEGEELVEEYADVCDIRGGGSCGS